MGTNKKNMKLSNVEIMKQIEEARKFQKSGKFKEAEKVYSDLLINNGDSFDLIYALFSKDLNNLVLAKKLLVNLTKSFLQILIFYCSFRDINDRK